MLLWCRCNVLVNLQSRETTTTKSLLVRRLHQRRMVPRFLAIRNWWIWSTRSCQWTTQTGTASSTTQSLCRRNTRLPPPPKSKPNEKQDFLCDGKCKLLKLWTAFGWCLCTYMFNISHVSLAARSKNWILGAGIYLNLGMGLCGNLILWRIFP